MKTSRKIYRNTLVLTVYTEDERLDKKDSVDLEQVLAEMTDGRYIGDFKIKPSKRIPTMKQVRRALKKIGNDGAFFDPI